MPLAVLLALLPPLVSEIGQGIREHLRRKAEKQNTPQIQQLEARIAELERWRRS